MTPLIFNASLAVGWFFVMVGVGLLHSVGAALLVGGVLLIVVTLLLAFKTGVRAAQAKGEKHVSD